MRGGEEFIAAKLYATPKAMSQYREVGGELTQEELCGVLKGITLTRMADDSPYYITRLEGIRFVCCVEHGRKLSSGRFAIVTVQRELASKGTK